MKKSKILGAILSLSMVINTLAVFMPVAQAANSKAVPIAEMLSEETAATLKAEWIFQGTKDTSYVGVDYFSTDGKHALRGFKNDNTYSNVKLADVNDFGSVMYTSQGGYLKYVTPQDIPAEEEGGEATVVEKPLNLTGKSATYELWAKISGAHNGKGKGMVMNRNGAVGTEWIIWSDSVVDGTGTVVVRSYATQKATVTYANTNTSDDPNKAKDWQHFVVVKEVAEDNSETTKFYINGECVATFESETPSDDNGDIILSASDGNGGTNERRWYSSFRVFESALTEAEIRKLYKYQGASLGLFAANADVSSITVNGEAVTSAGTKAYVKTVSNATMTASLNIATVGEADVVCTLNGAEIENVGNVPLEEGDNVITITSTATDEPIKTYTLNVIRLKRGESPTRNANLGVLTGKTMVADWYFDVADGASHIDEINGVELKQYSANNANPAEANFGTDNTFKKILSSSAGAGMGVRSSGSVATVDNARTWSGWVSCKMNEKYNYPVTIFAKSEGQDFVNPFGGKGWSLAMISKEVDGTLMYCLRITRGAGSYGEEHQKWDTEYFVSDSMSWRYITVSLSSTYGEAPALYINGEKQTLTKTHKSNLTGDIKSDAGIGMSVGFSNHSVKAESYIANLRVFKEQFTDEEALALYEAEGVAAGFIEIPVKITMSENWDGEIVATADYYSVGDRSNDTVLFIARYNKDGQLEECKFTTKELSNEVNIDPGDETDVVKAFVWDSLSTMKPISAVYDNTEL